MARAPNPRHTSALTLNVAGVIKDLLLIGYSVVVSGVCERRLDPPAHSSAADLRGPSASHASRPDTLSGQARVSASQYVGYAVAFVGVTAYSRHKHRLLQAPTHRPRPHLHHHHLDCSTTTSTVPPSTTSTVPMSTVPPSTMSSTTFRRRVRARAARASGGRCLPRVARTTRTRRRSRSRWRRRQAVIRTKRA